VESLVEALKRDEVGVVRRRASEALANLASKDPSQLLQSKAVKVMIEALQNNGEDSVRIAIVQALQHLIKNASQQLEGTPAVEALMKAMEEDKNIFFVERSI